MYEKRFWDSKFDLDDYNKQKSSLPAEEFYREANYVNYGQAPETDKTKVNAMVDELEKQYSLMYFQRLLYIEWKRDVNLAERERRTSILQQWITSTSKTKFSTRKLHVHLTNTHQKSKQTWKEEQHCKYL